jgi:ribosomal protein S18 acetylase RimI-like enzyme
MNKADIQIIEDYRDNDSLRNSFFELIDIVFPGLDFRSWHLKGYWKDDYIPYSIIDNDRIVSNVSISRMKIILDGKFVNGFQFGTVGTLPEYRHQGLSRILMEYVLNLYQSKADFFFLYANDSVIDFYPKFGFKRQTESVYKSFSNIPQPNFSARKLDINNENDFLLILDLIKKRQPLTKIFGAENYDFITVWHLINVCPNDLYYLEADNLLIIMTEKNEEMHIWEIIHQKDFDINLNISKIIESNNLKTIIYHFPPDQIKFNFDEIFTDENTLFFVKGNFGLEGKEFKLPVTAQT